jgi:hypothetical protein
MSTDGERFQQNVRKSPVRVFKKKSAGGLVTGARAR